MPPARMHALERNNSGVTPRSPTTPPHCCCFRRWGPAPTRARYNTRESRSIVRHAAGGVPLRHHPIVSAPVVASYVTGYDVRLLVRSPPIQTPAALKVAP